MSATLAALARALTDAELRELIVRAQLARVVDKDDSWELGQAIAQLRDEEQRREVEF